MDFWTVTLISLIAGLVLIIGGALVFYMGGLVKAAYQLKVEIRAEMDDGLRKIEEDTDKKSRWIKRDLVDEIEKIKLSVSADNQRKFAELADTLGRRLGEAEEALRHDRAETLKAVESLRRDIMVLDQRLRSLRRDQKLGAAESSPTGDTPIPLAALPAPKETPVAEPPLAAAPLTVTPA